MDREADNRTSVEAAISDVLGAEREAVAEIAACNSRADRILTDARKAVRAMARRTQQRLGRLHGGCSARTRELVADMERKAAANAKRPVSGELEQDMLSAAVRAVACELTEREPADAD